MSQLSEIGWAEQPEFIPVQIVILFLDCYNVISDADLHKDRRRDMSIAVYIRKEYYRAVTVKDKSAHILEFQYRPQMVDVFEDGYQVFHLEYVLETKTKAEIIEYYLTDFGLRGKGYGTACINEITDQLGKKGITLITAPTGYKLAPLGYTGPDQYHELMAGFYEKVGFSVSGNGDIAMKILEEE